MGESLCRQHVACIKFFRHAVHRDGCDRLTPQHLPKGRDVDCSSRRSGARLGRMAVSRPPLLPEGIKYICISRRSHCVTPNRLPPDRTNISRAGSDYLHSRNWPALPDQKDVPTFGRP
jgi:hypothetical protein